MAARIAVQDTKFVEDYVTEVLAARELLYVGLEKLKIPYIESQANFVLAQVGDRAIPIRDTLRDRGILVRDRSYELPGYLRFTVGTRDQVQRLLDELGRAFGEHHPKTRCPRIRYGRRPGRSRPILPRIYPRNRPPFHRSRRLARHHPRFQKCRWLEQRLAAVSSPHFRSRQNRPISRSRRSIQQNLFRQQR